jgi:hypothetical protein
VARTFSPPDGWVVDRRAWRAGWAVRRSYAPALPALARRGAAVRALLARAGRPERLTVVSDGSHTAASRALLTALDRAWTSCTGRRTPGSSRPRSGPTRPCPRWARSSRWSWHCGCAGRPCTWTPTCLLLDDGADLRGALGAPAYLLDEEDVYLDRRLLDGEAEAARPCNAGVLVLTERPDWGPALDRLARLHAAGEEPLFHTEQTVVHLTLRAAGALPLDPARFVCATDDMRVLRDAHPGPGLVLRHYTSPVRHRFWLAVGRGALGRAGLGRAGTRRTRAAAVSRW